MFKEKSVELSEDMVMSRMSSTPRRYRIS